LLFPKKNENYQVDIMSDYILTIDTAKWNVTSGTIPDPNNVYIQGSGPDGINIPSTKASVSGSTITLSSVAATTGFTPHVTKYYSAFNIQWQVSFDGGSTWQDAGTSENPIYVCISETGPSSVTLFRTVVHLACSNAGATNEDEAAAKTWALFAGPTNVNAWDETAQSYSRPLYYYKPGTTFGENPYGSAAALLQSPNNSGQCSTWAMLLKDSWGVNGVTSSYITANPSGYSGGNLLTLFLVKNWQFNASTSPDPGTWRFPWPSVSVPGNVYGDLLDQSKLSGQNSDTPSQKAFNNHQFLKFKSIFYDPSYGVTYASDTDFQDKAIAGFGYDTINPGTKYIIKTGTDLHIDFS
jgi:hypothetical protein